MNRNTSYYLFPIPFSYNKPLSYNLIVNTRLTNYTNDMSAEITLTNLVKRSFIEMMKDIGTSIPGHIIAFDPDTQLAQLQIGIVRIDADGETFTPPPIIECPVYIFGGSEFIVETQIGSGDEGIVVFSQRCIDAWVNSGGVAQNPILRFHDFSDACFLPGLRSQPNKISGYSNDGIRLRNKAGDHYMWLKSDGTLDMTNALGNITMTPDGTVNINGAIITPTGAISSPVSTTSPLVVAATSLTINGKEMDNHTHFPGTYNISGTPVTGNSGGNI